MTLSVYLNKLDLWNIWTMRCHEMPGTFWRHCSQSCVYSDEATWHLRWRNMSSNHWKWHFQDSKFQNVRRCFGPQELVPLVPVPKLPTIHHQPGHLKTFWQPWDPAQKWVVHLFPDKVHFPVYSPLLKAASGKWDKVVFHGCPKSNNNSNIS